MQSFDDKRSFFLLFTLLSSLVFIDLHIFVISLCLSHDPDLNEQIKNKTCLIAFVIVSDLIIAKIKTFMTRIEDSEE